MLHPLEQKLIALRRRVRRTQAVYTLSLAAVTLLAALAVFGGIDYLLRFQDRGLRIIVSLSALGVFGWTIYHFIGSSLFAPLRDVDLAQRAERFFPSLNDRLASAVEFLHESEDDPTAGSPALRRAAISQTTADTQNLDFSSILDSRPATRAAAILAMTCLLTGILVAIAPSASQTALVRLLNPFGNTAWPQTTRLAIRRPVDQIARGQNFQIEVIDARGIRLPPDVRIHYRLLTPDGHTVEETQPMRLVGGVMVAQRENIQRPFAYRVEGGDDRSMPWSEVEVVEPPTIESISIRLIPPPYTGIPASSSERRIRAIIGTRVEVTGRTSKPLASAVLCYEDGRKTPVQLADDGCGFSVADVVEKSGVYWFDLIDRQGIHGGDDRWEILAIADAAPTVHIEKPTAGLFVTPQAVVPLRISAKDDLALRNITLVFHLAESTPEQTLPLFSGLPQPPQQPAPAPAGDSRLIDYRWKLAPLNLQPGTQLLFHATADDYLPRAAKSEPRTLTIVTPDELRDRIADRETLIAAELQRALTMQRASREQIESLQTRLPTLRRFEQSDIDRLQTAEHTQRDVNQLLTGRDESVPMHLLAMLADLDNNGIANADARRRIASLLDELERLERELIPPIGHDLTAAVKTAQVDREGQGRGDCPDFRPNENGTVLLNTSGSVSAAVDGVAKLLTAVAERQDSIIASLQRQIAQLVRSDSYRRLHRDIGQLIRDQEDVTRRTSEVGRRTLTRDLRDLSPQDAANLTTAADRQLELARLLDRLLQQAAQANSELRKSDPAAADVVADALDEAARSTVNGRMRTAGNHIQQNRIGQAAAAQKQILRDLRKVLDLLAGEGRDESVQSPDAAQQARQGDGHGRTDAAQSPSRSPAESADASGSPDAQQPGSTPSAPGMPGATGKETTRKPNPAATRAIMKRLWGNLPKRQREQMLESPIEEFPPKYELQIEDYFRRLSEEKCGK